MAKVRPTRAQHQILAGTDGEPGHRLRLAVIGARRVHFHFGGDRALRPPQAVWHVSPISDGQVDPLRILARHGRGPGPQDLDARWTMRMRQQQGAGRQ
jgi:hypothetical protein